MSIDSYIGGKTFSFGSIVVLTESIREKIRMLWFSMTPSFFSFPSNWISADCCLLYYFEKWNWYLNFSSFFSDPTRRMSLFGTSQGQLPKLRFWKSFDCANSFRTSILHFINPRKVIVILCYVFKYQRCF